MRSYLAACAALFACGRLDFDREAAIDAPIAEGVDSKAPPNDGMTIDAAAIDSTVTGCPATYVKLQDSATRYRLFDTPATWLDAASACAADGAFTHLVVIADEQERSLVQAATPGTALWIGLSDRQVPNAYRWVTDEPVSYPPISGAPWASGQPSMGVGEDCVRTNGVADFDDDGCATMHAFACECDAFADDASRY